VSGNAVLKRIFGDQREEGESRRRAKESEYCGAP
jgi:hypothetical protein